MCEGKGKRRGVPHAHGMSIHVVRTIYHLLLSERSSLCNNINHYLPCSSRSNNWEATNMRRSITVGNPYRHHLSIYLFCIGLRISALMMGAHPTALAYIT